MQYITRKGGATATIFVPYDCLNHCPFCINKAEYLNKEGFSTDAIIESIKLVHSITPNCDFVFTGGEPMANLKDLQRMIDAIPFGHNIFINTTLPVNDTYKEIDLAVFLNQNYASGKLTGINVSRHLKGYVEECDDKIYDMLNFQARINCVIYNDEATAEDLIAFVERFKKHQTYIQFRKDYVLTTPENLYDTENDKLYQLLGNTFNYVGELGQYRMRCGYEYEYKGYQITYHKTLPYSKIQLDDDTFVLYDIIIKQTGSIREDWDVCEDSSKRKANKRAAELDIEAYRNVKFEDYN